MIIAGFDVASRTGICVMQGDKAKAIHVETWKSPAKRPENLKPQEADPEYEAAIAEPFRDHVRGILRGHDVQYVAYEIPRTRDYERTKVSINADAGWAGGAVKIEKERASSNLAMLRGFGLVRDLCGICLKLNIPVVGVSLDDWRRAFLGFSRAPKKDRSGHAISDGRKWLKAQTIAQCRLIGINVPNDDAADSVGVAFWLSGHLRLARLTRPGELFTEESASL